MKANLDPVKSDKKGELYDSREVAKAVVNRTKEKHFFSGNKAMNDDMKDIQAAQAKIDAMLDVVSNGMSKLTSVEQELSKKAKLASGNLRDSAEKLAQGLARVEKAANFDRLENLVHLLERAAAAMTTLAELDKSGKLERIAVALK